MSTDSQKLTIVIPTRERCDTLQATLKTCVTQDYANLEIIVSDNFSQDNTREVVRSFDDNRIRYINTGKRVGMSTNWEFALSHVTDGYVTYIGDDDGFLPSAISKIEATIGKLGKIPTFAWVKPMFKWPDYSQAGSQNTLFMHMTNQQVITFEARHQLERVVRFKSSWGSLSSIYNSFVSMELINAVKRRGNGRFFNSSIPDVYSAVVIASTVPNYHYSLRPYTVAGVSRYSTGDSFTNVHLNAGPSQQFLSENEIPIHSKMVMSSLSTICVAECFLQAQDLHLTPETLSLGTKTVIKAALREASEEAEGRYVATLRELREIGKRNGLETWVENEIANAMHSSAIESKPISGHDLRRHGLVINCSDFDVKDIYDATLLCDRILNSSRFEFLFPLGTLALTTRAFVPVVRKRVQKALGLRKR